MTVPPGFRRTAKAPEVLVLHRGQVQDSECSDRWGYRVTKPFRTVLDILSDGGVSLEQVQMAISQAVSRGLVLRKEYDKLKVHPVHGKLVRDLMGEEK
jgi:hypothetical protein